MHGVWRRIMASRFAEDVWYLLTIFNCVGYMVLLVVIVVWLRLVLHAVEDALVPIARRPKPLPVAQAPVSTTYAEDRYCA